MLAHLCISRHARAHVTPILKAAQLINRPISFCTHPQLARTGEPMRAADAHISLPRLIERTRAEQINFPYNKPLWPSFHSDSGNLDVNGGIR